MARNQFSMMTPEQRAECGRKGGKASGETKRRKKAMKETLEVLLAMPVRNGKYADIESIKSFGQLKGKNINVQEAILISMIQRALKGDVHASEFVRNTAGENPMNCEANQTKESSAQPFIDALNDGSLSLESAGDDVEE